MMHTEKRPLEDTLRRQPSTSQKERHQGKLTEVTLVLGC